MIVLCGIVDVEWIAVDLPMICVAADVRIMRPSGIVEEVVVEVTVVVGPSVVYSRMPYPALPEPFKPLSREILLAMMLYIAVRPALLSLSVSAPTMMPLSREWSMSLLAIMLRFALC